MYEHTKNVNAYYFAEIGLSADNGPDIFICRKNAFEALEKKKGYWENRIFGGRGGEEWTIRKVCRRFVWHDCIHGKAMYRMAKNLPHNEKLINSFFFE